MIALDGIQKALEAHTARLTAEPRVAFEGLAFTPEGNRPFITTQVSGRDRTPMGLTADTPHLWRGTWSVVVKHPAGEGLSAPYARAAVIAEHFRRATSLPVTGGVTCLVVQSVNIPLPYTTAGWVSLPVVINWTYEEHAT